MTHLRWVLLLAVLLVALVSPTQVLAVTYNQPTTFTLGDASGAMNPWAYQNVLEPGDQLVLARYYVYYAVPADAPDLVGDAYLGVLRYNGTVIGTASPYSIFNASGVSEWFFAIYLTATQVDAWDVHFDPAPPTSPMWGTPAGYSVQLIGNPTLTWAGGTPPAPQQVSDFADGSFNTDTTVDTTRMEQLIRYLGTYFENRWGGTTDMVEDVGGVLKLTADGEQYFGASIQSLRSMAPGVYADSLSAAEFEDITLIEDYYVARTDTTISVYGANWYAQTFTATDSYPLSGVNLRMRRVGSPGTVTVSLRATAAGLPSGADVVSGTYAGNSLTTYTGGEWYDVVFTANSTLVEGTTYALVIRATAGDVNNRVVIPALTAGAYSGGQRCTSVNSGAAWAANAGSDFVFALVSLDAVSGAYADKLASRLDETEFGNPSGGFIDLANILGLTRGWTTSLIWFAISIGTSLAVVRTAGGNQKALLPTMQIMIPIGGITGFLDWWIVVFAAFICAVALVCSVTWLRSSA